MVGVDVFHPHCAALQRIAHLEAKLDLLVTRFNLHEGLIG